MNFLVQISTRRFLPQYLNTFLESPFNTYQVEKVLFLKREPAKFIHTESLSFSLTHR